MDDKILNYVSKYTKLFLTGFDPSVAPITENISNELKIDRTLVSKRLNMLFRENKIKKINTRPVIYLSVSECHTRKSKYSSIADFKMDYNDSNKKDVLKGIIGWNGSLKIPIEQIRAAMLYPDNGLPAIIFGQSGTGKSYLIKKSFEYAKSIKLFSNDSKLVIVNCAQYANNPELLSSVLFGYVKGAFTGADSDKIGAIESSNNGILFLDEVHRLSPAGQEKLFTYMDSGSFTPIGDDSKIIKSKTRLMFATTENRTKFLETFLRRVPIKIQLPSLNERSPFEKRVLVKKFISNECKRINKTLYMTDQSLNKMCDYEYEANVGEVKNVIKNIIAKKYSENLDKPTITIKVIDLPAKIANADDKNGLMEVVNDNHKLIKFTPDLNPVNNEMSENTIYYKIQKTWNYIESLDEREILDREKFQQIVMDMTQHILYTLSPHEKEIITSISQNIRDILEIMHFDEFLFKNSSVYELSLYIYYLMQEEQFETNLDGSHISQKLYRLFNKEITLLTRLKPFLEGKFEITLNKKNMLWMSILISKADIINVVDTPAIIMAHGYATASSMADTSNRILKSPLYYSLDMKPDVDENKMIEELKKLINDIRPKNGIVLLIDMGSLNVIINKVKDFYSLPMLIINNVSTPIALEVGNALINNKSFKEISNKIEKTRLSINILNNKAIRDNVIFTTCMTGMGTARRIEKILTDSFEGLINVKVIPVDYHELVNYKQSDLQNKFNILAIVGVDNPNINDVPYFGLEEIISGEKISELKKTLSQVASQEQLRNFESQLVKNFSLNRIIDSLTIISPDKVMSVIEKYISKLDKQLHISLSNRVQIALYVHIASMIERIVRGNSIKVYNGNNKNIVKDSTFSVIKRSASVIERSFAIKINDTEIAFIRDIVKGL